MDDAQAATALLRYPRSRAESTCSCGLLFFPLPCYEDEPFKFPGELVRGEEETMAGLALIEEYKVEVLHGREPSMALHLSGRTVPSGVPGMPQTSPDSWYGYLAFENRADLRFEPNAAPDTIRVHLPVGQFDRMYHLVQTEAPVYLWWFTNEDDMTGEISLRTMREPPGEGLADHSPGDLERHGR